MSRIKACDVPLLADSKPWWSHSDYCLNWSYVRDFSQILNADRSMVDGGALILTVLSHTTLIQTPT